MGGPRQNIAMTFGMEKLEWSISTSKLGQVCDMCLFIVFICVIALFSADEPQPSTSDVGYEKQAGNKPETDLLQLMTPGSHGAIR